MQNKILSEVILPREHYRFRCESSGEDVVGKRVGAVWLGSYEVAAVYLGECITCASHHLITVAEYMPDDLLPRSLLDIFAMIAAKIDAPGTGVELHIGDTLAGQPEVSIRGVKSGSRLRINNYSHDVDRYVSYVATALITHYARAEFIRH